MLGEAAREQRGHLLILLKRLESVPKNSRPVDAKVPCAILGNSAAPLAQIAKTTDSLLDSSMRCGMHVSKYYLAIL